MIEFFINNLQDELNCMIKDYVRVLHKNGILKVYIKETDKFEFSYIVKRIDFKIVNGLNSKILAEEIAKKYKKWLLHRHFNEIFFK